MPADQPTTGASDAMVALPVDPFVSNRYHFGMLLGVADLEAEQAYHRGKTWMHSAWLHGAGTVWGLGVEVRADRNELVVLPGLAIDGHGRELQVRDEQCVDLGRWYQERRPDDLDPDEDDDGSVSFTITVELCHAPCLDRPVPSISEPCDDASFDTAYSRAVERGIPRLVAGPAPSPPHRYPRVRQFLGAEATDDELVARARADIDAAPADEVRERCGHWLRRLIAADTIDLAPAGGANAWSPVEGDGCVPLADVHVRLRPDGDRFRVVVDGDAPTEVDPLIRPAHLATRTTQELLCCCSTATGEGPAEEPDDDPGDGGDDAVPASGPQVLADAATIDGRTITIPLSEAVDPRSVLHTAIGVASLRSEDWGVLDVRSATLDDAGTTLTVTLAGTPSARPLRVVVPGAGLTPLLSVDGRPLDGISGIGTTDPTGRDAALLLS